MKNDPLDPSNLIRESYRIEGIGIAECRSIFLDWALKLSGEIDQQEAIRTLLDRHGAEGHPMTQVLTEGLGESARTGRRGGRAGRVRSG